MKNVFYKKRWMRFSTTLCVAGAVFLEFWVGAGEHLSHLLTTSKANMAICGKICSVSVSITPVVLSSSLGRISSLMNVDCRSIWFWNYSDRLLYAGFLNESLHTTFVA